MGKKFEGKLIKTLYFFGIASFIYFIKKPLSKDWLLVFFIKSYFTSMVDQIVVKRKLIEYPSRSPSFFSTSFLFDYLLFPMTCVFYNQLTKDSRIINTIIKVFYFSIPMTIVELWLERNTKLVKYKKGWNWKTTFFSVSASFLLVRFSMFLIRKLFKNTYEFEQFKR